MNGFIFHQVLRLRHNMMLFVASLLLLWLAALLYYAHQRTTAMQASAEAKAQLTGRIFANLLEEESKFLQGQLDFLQESEPLRRAWLKKDRKALYEAVQPLFTRLLGQFEVTHFYFIEPAETVFLRAHSPKRHGDKPRRHTLRQASESEQLSTGIELGHYGHFTLRVVLPWRFGGKHQGFLELGREIGHITPKLAQNLGADLFFFIDKQYLEPTAWKQGQALVHKHYHWDEFEREVLIDSNLSELDELHKKLLTRAARVNLWNLLNPFEEIKGHFFGELPLVDAAGVKLGRILLLQNQQREYALLQSTLYSQLVLIAIGALLLRLFYAFLLKASQSMQEAQDRLRTHAKALEESNRQLTHAKRQAEKATLRAQHASGVKSDFLARMSHELRTPMNAVIGMIEHSLTGPLAPETRENLTIADQAAHSLLELLNGILDFSQLDNHEIDIQLKLCDLRHCLTDWTEMERTLFEQKGLQLELSIHEKVPQMVMADEDHLHQVLAILLENARKFSEKGTTTVRVTLPMELEKSYHLLLQVADQGIGIESKHRARIFTEFTQSEDPLNRKYGGSGLGLAIAKGLVELMGGQIWVESEPGEGSLFFVELPLPKPL